MWGTKMMDGWREEKDVNSDTNSRKSISNVIFWVGFLKKVFGWEDGIIERKFNVEILSDSFNLQ